MLEQTLNRIRPRDAAAMAAAREHHKQLAIPEGSLGRLHEIGIWLAGVTGRPQPRIAKRAVITMAGDHGVAAQGVSLFPQAVTREMVANFLRRGAAINVLARHFGIRLTVVDIGVAGPLPDIRFIPDPMLDFVEARLSDGTGDIFLGPAMEHSQARAALETGIGVFKKEFARGLDAVGTGDMGIANTTPSAAVAAALLKRDPAGIVNRGTGIDDATLEHKLDVVRHSLACNRPDADDPLDVLAKVGGYEIGGIAGVILAACAQRVPVVVDGFISSAAALLASRFNPHVKSYLVAGHRSAVLGHEQMLQDLALKPLVDLGLRLGEGTGAVYGLSILASAAAVSSEVLTFEEAAVSQPQQGR